MIDLIIPTFIAGLLTFLAPCTLPLVPGYLGFISGVSAQDLQSKQNSKSIRKKIFLNGLLYVVGFSIVFILFGIIFSYAGAALVGYRIWLTRIGAVFVIFFGLYLMQVFNLKVFNFMQSEHRLNLAAKLVPGKPSSSLLFGATFAFGWSPCVGPVLASVLFLTSTVNTVWQGAILLSIFSLGLATPFLIVALAMSGSTNFITRISKYLKVISFVGGLFLVFLGILLLTNNLGFWTQVFYDLFSFLQYDKILDFM